jgi:hypothetical protein
MGTRRNFIQSSLLTAGGILFYPSARAAVFRGRRFYPGIGVCTDFSKSNLLKDCGYSFIEEGVGKFLVPSESEDVFLKNLEQARKASLPVKVLNSFLPAELKCIGYGTDSSAILKFAETAFQRARMASIQIVVFGSGKARRIPEGFPRMEAQKQFEELCRNMANLALRNNVTILLEPLNTDECNFINSVAEGGEFIKKVDHPNFLLLADLYHMKKVEESPGSIIRYGHLLRHVHIAEKEGRSAPGTSNEDFTEYFRALKKIGYRGLISIECRWQDMGKQLPVAIRAIHDQINSL